MAPEKLKLFSKIELDLVSSAPAPLVLLTDIAGQAMQPRFTWTVPASTIVNGVLTRRTATSRIPYNATGHLVQAIYKPAAGQTAILYRCRIWGRELPGGQWQWYPVPVIETPVEFSPVPLPIPPTSEEWHPAELPIPPTTEKWRETGLAIPPTTEEWRAVGLPIPPTSEEWRAVKLPIRPTPDAPDWVDLEIDR